MTDRHTADTINDDDLDQLYDRLAKLAQTIAAFPNANDAANLAHARAQRDQFLTRAQQAEAAITRVRALADRWDNALAPDKPYARALRAALDEPDPAVTEAARPGVLSFDRRLTDSEVEEIKARWRREYGNNQGAHPVTELRTAGGERQMEQEIAGRIAITDAACDALDGEEQPGA